MGCPDNPCWCANNTEFIEENLRMVEQPFERRIDAG
jgi:hypothetical protein